MKDPKEVALVLMNKGCTDCAYFRVKEVATVFYFYMCAFTKEEIYNRSKKACVNFTPRTRRHPEV